MIIKDIRNFRKFYKETILQIDDPKRNENFIGHSFKSNGEIKYGFFELFHGDKKDINKFITPFLRMAQDWQAIYELLQNAYDSNSRNFALFFDKEYLLAFNNGNQFSVEGIRSILNIGQSTKESKSDIGKFGVGFKIVHRLIGETDGKKELNELNGPIIFSWSKFSDLESLVKVNSLDDIEFKSPDFQIQDDQFISKDTLPWLFKILITNFPCGLNDEILDLSYKPLLDTFSINDINLLNNIIKEKILYSGVFVEEQLTQGTIVFLRLGKNKYKQLGESHIKQGIAYSLSILNNLQRNITSNKLEKIYINDITHPFSPADIKIEKFLLSRQNHEYQNLVSDNIEDAPEIIEYYFGYSTSVVETVIKSNPNLYLYFPVSDEIHNYNFIIHCNYFENLSQRTNLAEVERNRQLLKTLSKLLINRLEDFKQSNFEKYILIYAAILTSDWKPITNKSWVFENLLEPLIVYSKENIPTITEHFNSKIKVRIKDTGLDITPAELGVSQFEWFYFNNEDIVKEARNFAKLGVDKANLQNLVNFSSNVSMINTWLKNHTNKVEEFIKELNGNPIKRTEWLKYARNSTITPLARNILNMKLFLFSDKNYYSINEIKSKNNLFILSKNFEELRETYKSLGFHTCFFDQNQWQNIFELIKVDFPHLADKTKFLDYFAYRIETVNGVLNFSQLQSLISFFNETTAPVLTKIIIYKVGEGYKISTKLNTHQCYFTANKTILKNCLLEKYSKNIIKLEDELYNLIENKTGIWSENDLYKSLLSECTDNSDIIDVILEADSIEIHKEFIEKIHELILIEGRTYSKETYEHKILELVISTESENFRDKIKIKTENDTFIPLDNITYSNKVIFKSEADNLGQYELSLSNILQRYSTSSELIENVIKSFVDFKEYNLRTFVFKVGRQKGKDEILNEIDNVLMNSHQLAFILLYGLFDKKKTTDFSKYKIILKNGEQEILKQVKYYIQTYNFISENNILSECYVEIIDLLKLNDVNPVFSSLKLSVAMKPHLDKSIFYCFPLKYTLKDDSKAQKELFFHLYSEFAKQPQLNDHIKIDGTDRSPSEIKYVNENIQLVLGFDPYHTGYPSKYCLEDEEMPQWINDWLMQSDYHIKINYLKALGLNTEDSLMIQIRKYLINNISTLPILEELEKLGNYKLNFLEKALQWVANQSPENAAVVEKTDKYNFYKYIYDCIQLSSKYPILKITDITSYGALVFEMVKVNNEEKIYLLTKEQKQTLISLGISLEIFRKFLSYCKVLIFDDVYAANALFLLEFAELTIKLILDEKILFGFNELTTASYQNWKNETDNKFKIFSSESETSLTYQVFINEFELSSIRKNKIDITAEGNIYLVGSIESISDHLQSIVGREGFTEDVFKLFIQKQKNEPEEVSKLFNLQFEDLDEDILKKIAEDNSSFFPAGEIKSFSEKLIELLTLYQSPWAGYIYHFTHLENAVNILKNKKIQSRNKADFKDSAGQAFITTTLSKIKDFARFYFRPLTPTQFYNQGLGKFIKNTNELPQCPVPIFIRFRINEVLDLYRDKCYVSNGNLRHYPQTNYGNSYEFLKSFDFQNVYKKYNECERWTFLNASQQEFIVRDELDFSDINSTEIICKSDVDKISLINLLGPHSNLTNKIKVDSSYYYSDNPIVDVFHDKGKIKVSIPVARNIDSLKVISTKMDHSDRSMDIIKANRFIEIESRNSNYSIFYLNKSTNREWLIYTDGELPLSFLAAEINNNKIISSII